MHRLALLLLFTSCTPVVTSGEGEGAAEGEGASEGEGEVTAFALTSSAFADGGIIPATFTCNGADVSPPLAWVGAPASTGGFAIALTDLTIGLVHATLWDIAPTATTLPQGIDNSFTPANVDGAHQSLAYDGTTRGWLGPCPPSVHTYELKLYAAADRPLTGLDESSSRDDVKAALEATAIGTATLTATYAP